MMDRRSSAMSALSALSARSGSSAHGHKYRRVASADLDHSEESDNERDRERDYRRLSEILGHLRNFRKKTRKSLWIAIVMAVGIVLFLYWAVFSDVRVSATGSCDDWKIGYTCQPEISQFWGQYSPYFSVESELPTEVPDECHITFAQVLSRHGARDPTSSKTAKYNATVQKIHANVESYSKSYALIKDYTYELQADQLSVFGQQQLINSGHQFYERYQKLTKCHTPFVRSSGQERVVESAQNWTQGFHKARLADNAAAEDSSYPYSIVLMSEDDGSNNTLSHGLCTDFEASSDTANQAQQTWSEIFTPPITARLNKNLPGANLTEMETIYMMDLCPFETVHDVNGKVSPFCALFTEKEWKQYDYYQSLGKYYGYGWGNALGATQGVGFTNELIARLTDSAVVDHTATNHTLDNNNATFPVGGKTVLYADFSHDNDMTAIFAAMGLYNSTMPLLNETLETAQETKGYAASWTVSFGARMYVEKMSCKGEAEELVRVVVNDRVIPMKTCDADRFGRCGLGAFVDSLGFARAGGDWDKCFL